MLTTKHLGLLSIAALSLAAVTPALAGPGVQAMLKGHSPAVGEPGITLVAKRSGSPRAVGDVNERRRRAGGGVNENRRATGSRTFGGQRSIGDPGIKLGGKKLGNPRAFNPQPDVHGKLRATNPPQPDKVSAPGLTAAPSSAKFKLDRAGFRTTIAQRLSASHSKVPGIVQKFGYAQCLSTCDQQALASVDPQGGVPHDCLFPKAQQLCNQVSGNGGTTQNFRRRATVVLGLVFQPVPIRAGVLRPFARRTAEILPERDAQMHRPDVSKLRKQGWGY